MKVSKSDFPNVYLVDRFFATLSLDPGRKVYNERTVHDGADEYRVWDAFRSKLCGAMKKGLKMFPFADGTKVLYLGASTGTTISHLSDVVGPKGEIYAIEISPQCMKPLIALSDRRPNIIPIHADAHKTDEYVDVGQVDVVYQDVAQPDQDVILIKNAKAFLKQGGIAMICIKSQSIDVTKEPKVVFKMVMDKFAKDFDVVETLELEPYDKDHLFAVLKFKG